MNAVRIYFEYKSAADFKRDWMKLTDTDKAQLKAGCEDGTLTY